jgi:hypothetical protein
MAKSLAEAKMRSAPPVPFQFLAMGTVPATDPDFLKWKETQEEGLTTVTAMARYMPHFNAQRRETFEEELAEHQAFLEFNRLEGLRMIAEQQNEMDRLKTRILEQHDGNEVSVPNHCFDLSKIRVPRSVWVSSCFGVGQILRSDRLPLL